MLASGLQKCLVALLVASRAAEFAKPWKSEGSAALALPSVIQHSPVQKLCECPADFRGVEATCKSVLWLSWLPHALVSSPNLGRFGRLRLAVRHTAQSRSKSVLYDECSTGGAFDTPTQRTINTLTVSRRSYVDVCNISQLTLATLSRTRESCSFLLQASQGLAENPMMLAWGSCCTFTLTTVWEEG